MTLKQFFELIATHPAWILTFFLLVPLTALLALLLGKGEGHLTPWRQLYATLIYLICIPGIFAITLSIYFFLFERRSILDTDIFTQVLPLLSMGVTLLLIRRNVSFDAIPGFRKLSGLMMIIASTLIFMWFIDRTRIIVFSYLPFYYVLIIFGVLLLAVRFGWSRIFPGK